MKELTVTKRAVLFVLLLTSILSFGSIITVSHWLTKPLKKITNLMLQVRNGDFSVRFHSRTHDEIGILGNSFNLLLEQLERLIDEKVLLRNKEKQMEVDILKSQINPHFIYKKTLRAGSPQGFLT